MVCLIERYMSLVTILLPHYIYVLLRVRVNQMVQIACGEMGLQTGHGLLY